MPSNPRKAEPPNEYRQAMNRKLDDILVWITLTGIHPTKEEEYTGLSTVSGDGWYVFFTMNLLEWRLDTLVRYVDAPRE